MINESVEKLLLVNELMSLTKENTTATLQATKDLLFGKIVESISDEEVKIFEEIYAPGGVAETAISTIATQLYEEYYTTEELKFLIKLYKTPEYKEIANKMRQLAPEMVLGTMDKVEQYLIDKLSLD